MNKFMKAIAKKGITAKTFMNEYWKKKPLFVENVFNTSNLNFIQPEEILGLAQHEDVESRFMSYDRQTHSTELKVGPYEDASFIEKLPKESWTILIQKLDKMLLKAELLKQEFNFLPDWLFDDVMISLAAANGGVGPHFDHYDVFLVQGIGQRRWRYGSDICKDKTFIEGLDFKILKNFEYENEVISKPGDVLYLPPHVAHDGTALGDSNENWCTTFSVGTRAPSLQEILVSLVPKVDRDVLIHDIKWNGDSSSEFDQTQASHLSDQVIKILKGYLNKDFFSEYLTQSGESPVEQNDIDLTRMLKNSNSLQFLRLEPEEKIVFSQNPKTIEIYIAGVLYPIESSDQVIEFVHTRKLAVSKLTNRPTEIAFFQKLLSQNLVYLSDC